MRRHLQFVASAILTISIACNISDSTVGPLVPERSIPRSVVIPPTNNAACTIHWTSAVNGDWFDPTKWTPAGVPDSTSSVCIDVAGIYRVYLDPAVDSIPVPVLAISIGGAGATPTLEIGSNGGKFNVKQGVAIAAGGILHFSGTGSTLTTGGTITNAGTLKVTAPCGGCGGATISADIINSGAITIAGDPVLTLSKVNGGYQNTGNITFGGYINIPASAGNVVFSQEGGVYGGAANFNTLTMRSGVFQLKGGKIRSRANPAPIVVLDGASLVIDSTATDSVTIGVRGRTDVVPTITGNVPPLMTLWIAGAANGGAGQVALIGNPFNRGTMGVTPRIDVYGGITVTGAGRLTNLGTINNTDANRDTLFYSIDLTNNGTINAIGQSSIVLQKAGGSYQNSGLIDLQASISRLVIRSNSTFSNTSPATITNGAVEIDGSQFIGTGTLATTLNVQNGGSVAPGFPFGLLTSNQLNVASTGILNIELGGNTPVTQYDRAVATSTAGFSGTLNVSEINGFKSGLCGQVFDVVYAPSAAAGMFPVINGLNPAPGRMLRAMMVGQTTTTPAIVRLVGFDPNLKVCAGPDSVSLTEGGAALQYAVALRDAPTSTVIVKAVGDAQVSAPDSAIFTTSNWQTPQILHVSAIDDNVFEGTHSGTVTHTVRSTDAAYNGVAAGSITATITDNDSPPLVPTAVTVAIDSSSIEAGHTAQASAVVRDQNGDVMAGETVVWSSNTPSFASVSVSGVVTGVAAGSAVIKATDGSAFGTASVTVTAPPPPPPVVTTISVSVDSTSLQEGHTAQASATVRDQYNAVMSGQTITWSTDTPLRVSVSNAGVVTAISAGSASIRATVGSVSNTASLTITAPPPPPPVVTTISVSIDSSSLQVGHTAQATAVVRDQYGAVMSGQTVTWSSNTPSFVSVTSAGVVTAVAEGTGVIKAAIGAVFGTGSVSISAAPPPPPVVTTVSVSIDSSSLQVGHTAQATATVRDQNNNVMNGQTITWSSDTPGFASVTNAGVVTGVAAGNATIRATVGSVSGIASLIVTAIPPAPPAVTTIEVTIDSASLQVGNTAQATATVKDQYGAVISDQSVTWSSNASGFASVSNLGVVTGMAEGTAVIKAAIGGVFGTSSLTITALLAAPPSVTSIEVAIDSASLRVGGTAQATATVKDQYGAVMSGQAVTWSSNTPSFASVSNLGIISGLAAGTAEIKAAIGGVFGTGSLSITPAVERIPTTLSVSLDSTQIYEGSTTQARATVRDQFGEIISGLSVVWSTNDTTTATVSSTGLVTTRTFGASFITATLGGLSGGHFLYIFMRPPPPPGDAAVIQINYIPEIREGEKVQAVAQVFDKNGTYVPNAVVKWSSLNGKVFSVSPGGMVTGLRAGAGLLQATSGTASGTRDVTVLAPSVPTTIQVYLLTTLSLGDTARVVARVADQYGKIMKNQPVVWTVETPGTIALVGTRECPVYTACVVLQGLRPGNGRVRATLGKLSDAPLVYVFSQIDKVFEGQVSKSSKYTINWWPGCSWDIWIENARMTSDWRSPINAGRGALAATVKMQSTAACTPPSWSADVSFQLVPTPDGFELQGGPSYLSASFQMTDLTKKGMSGLLTFHFIKFGGENGRTFDIAERIDLK